MKSALCGLSPRPNARAPCVQVGPACVRAEQIVLQNDSTAAARHQAAMHLLERAKDLMNARKLFRPEVHQTVVVDGSSSYAESAVPLMVNAAHAHAHLDERNRSRFAVDWPQREKLHNIHHNDRQQGHGTPREPHEPRGLIFVTTWSNAWQEVYQRAVVQLFERWCDANVSMDIVPAAFGSTASEAAASQEQQQWIGPFSSRSRAIWPLALMPSPPGTQQAIFGNRPCNSSMFASYVEASEWSFAARPHARCFERLELCDFGLPTSHARPWSTMQAVLAHDTHDDRRPGEQGGPSAAQTQHWTPRLLAVPGVLRVLFVNRTRRRRLSNLEVLLSACQRWRPPNVSEASARGFPPDGRIECASHDFSSGLHAATPMLMRADVLVGPHGADLINGLGMHAGSSVLEIMPTHRAFCPCDFFRSLFAAERSKIFHYTASSSNHSHSIGRTYNADLVPPEDVLHRALAVVMEVGGRPELYKFKDFEYA